jgi:hypothetical protein
MAAKPKKPATPKRRPKPSGKPIQKKKRAPKGMTGPQKDALASAEDRKLTSVTQKLKDGKIDHGDAASPERGVLDPADFEKFEIETRPTMNETQRISKVICEHLDEHYSRGGKFKWTCGYFLETDPRANGDGGFQALTTEMIGDAWSTQLTHELGLTIYNGALCWSGRGTFERHIICVKTKELQMRQLTAKEEAMNQQLSQPEQVGEERMGRLEVKETVKRVPLTPGKPGDGLEESDEVAQ